VKYLAQQYYFYLENLAWLGLELCPPFIRTIVFRLVFKRFGPGSSIDYGSYVRYPWKVSIGSHAAINRGCRIYASLAIKEVEIVIGDNVALGPGVILCSAGHDYATLALKDIAGTISIWDHSWIGANSLILPSVDIGEGAVVGAGSVVTKNVPAWTVVAGNPARQIKARAVLASVPTH
jgi:acetyltransferase-like isoleucine patch superfamily enzyme